MAQILFFLDEDSASGMLVQAIKDAGHMIELSTDHLGQGAEDRNVSKHANDLAATLVTRNKKHFQKAVGRIPESNQRKLRHCSVIFLRCNQGANRFRLFEPLITREYELCQGQSDKRIVVEITDRVITFHR